MKALEILKNQRLGLLKFERDTQIQDEAIAELEALQTPKMCNGCNNYGKNFGYGFDKDYCINLHMFTKDTFGCIEHEPKAQQ